MAQKAHQPQPAAAPTLSHEPQSVQLHNASPAPQQLFNAPTTSLDSLQAASGCPPDQPLQPTKQCPVGRQTEADAAVLQHPDAVGGQQPQVEARHNGTQHETEADLQRLEQEFVHDVYNAIAPHFSATRFAIWPKVLDDCCAPFNFSIDSQLPRADLHGTATRA